MTDLKRVKFKKKSSLSPFFKATAIVVIGAFLFNTALIDLAWAYAGIKADGYLRVPAVKGNSKIEGSLLASLRVDRKIWVAHSAKYVALLNSYKAHILLLPGGGYLISPELGKKGNEWLLRRKIRHEDIELLMQREEIERSTRYRRLQEQVLNDEAIVQAYYRQLAPENRPPLLQNESLLQLLLKGITETYQLKSQKDKTREKAILFNDIIASGFELLLLPGEDGTGSTPGEKLPPESELNPQEREFRDLIEPILEAQDSQGQYKNFSAVFFDGEKRKQLVKKLQTDKEIRFYKAAGFEFLKKPGKPGKNPAPTFDLLAQKKRRKDNIEELIKTAAQEILGGEYGSSAAALRALSEAGISGNGRVIEKIGELDTSLASIIQNEEFNEDLKTEAILALKVAAQKGNQPAVKKIGELAPILLSIIESEKFGENIKVAARRALGIAAQEGNQQSIEALALIIQNEKLSDEVRHEALTSLNVSAEMGNHQAAIEKIGELDTSLISIVQNKKLSLSFREGALGALGSAAEKRNQRAAEALALIIRNKELETSFRSQALQSLRKAANGENQTAIKEIGKLATILVFIAYHGEFSDSLGLSILEDLRLAAKRENRDAIEKIGTFSTILAFFIRNRNFSDEFRVKAFWTLWAGAEKGNQPAITEFKQILSFFIKNKEFQSEVGKKILRFLSIRVEEGNQLALEALTLVIGDKNLQDKSIGRIIQSLRVLAEKENKIAAENLVRLITNENLAEGLRREATAALAIAVKKGSQPAREGITEISRLASTIPPKILASIGPEGLAVVLSKKSPEELLSYVTLGGKLYPGKDRHRSVFNPTTNPQELAGWIKPKMGKSGEMQISVGFDTGGGIYKHRPKFIALAFLIITFVLEGKIRTLKAAPQRDRSANYGIVIRGINVNELNEINQENHRLDYIMDVSKNITEKDLAHFISLIQYLNLGLLLSTAHRSYYRLTGENFPEISREQIAIIKSYEEFEQELVRILRKYNSLVTAENVCLVEGQEQEHKERQEALRKYHLEEVLWPDKEWLVDLSNEEDTSFNKLLPYLRGAVEAVILQAETEEDAELIGDQFIAEVHQLFFDKASEIKEILEGKKDSAISSLSLAPERDPFLDLDYLDASIRYAQAMIGEEELVDVAGINYYAAEGSQSGGKPETLFLDIFAVSYWVPGILNFLKRILPEGWIGKDNQISYRQIGNDLRKAGKALKNFSGIFNTKKETTPRTKPVERPTRVSPKEVPSEPQREPVAPGRTPVKTPVPAGLWPGSPAAMFNRAERKYKGIKEFTDGPKIKPKTARRDLKVLEQAGLLESKGEGLTAEFRISLNLPGARIKLARAYLNNIFNMKNPKNRGNVKKYWSGKGRDILAETLRENFVEVKEVSVEQAENTYEADAGLTAQIISEIINLGKREPETAPKSFTVTVNERKTTQAQRKALSMQIKHIAEKSGLKIDLRVISEKNTPAYLFECKNQHGQLIGKAAINLQTHKRSLDRTLAILAIGLAASAVPENLVVKEPYAAFIKHINDEYKLLDLLGGELIKEKVSVETIREILHHYPIDIILPPVEKPGDFRKEREFELQQEALRSN